MKLVNKINTTILLGLLMFSGLNMKAYAEDKGVGFNHYPVSQDAQILMLVGLPMLAVSIAFPPAAIIFAAMIAAPHIGTPQIQNLHDLIDEAYLGDGNTLKIALDRMNKDFKNAYKEASKLSKDYSLIVVTKQEFIQATIQLNEVVEISGVSYKLTAYGYLGAIAHIRNKILFNRLPDEEKRKIEYEMKKEMAKNRFKNRFPNYNLENLFQDKVLTENEANAYLINRNGLREAFNEHDFIEYSNLAEADKILDEQESILGSDAISAAKKLLRYELRDVKFEAMLKN